MAKKNKMQKPAEAIKAAPVEQSQEEQAPKVAFDSWYAARASAIPAVHKKEIIKADFKGRKVPMISTMEEFDLALKKYGVELD
jgi:hypothetical protein